MDNNETTEEVLFYDAAQREHEERVARGEPVPPRILNYTPHEIRLLELGTHTIIKVFPSVGELLCADRTVSPLAAPASRV